MKQKIIAGYLAIGVLFALYSWMFGDMAHKSFAYNLGRGIIWPAVMFPALGQAIGTIILVVFVGVLIFS